RPAVLARQPPRSLCAPAQGCTCYPNTDKVEGPPNSNRLALLRSGRARCVPDSRVNQGEQRSLPDRPIRSPTWDNAGSAADHDGLLSRRSPCRVILTQERHNVAVSRRELGPLGACVAALALTACATGCTSAAPAKPTGSASSRSQLIPHAH